MNENRTQEAWVRIPKESERPPVSTSRYNFGFRPAMGRFLESHD